MKLQLSAVAIAVLVPVTQGPGQGNESTVERPRLRGRVLIDGSAAAFPLLVEATKQFRSRVAPHVRIVIAARGNAGGFGLLSARRAAIWATSRPILKSEVDKLRKRGIEFIELPVAHDALAVVVNARNDWVDHLTRAELRQLFFGKVRTWSDLRKSWPDVSVRVIADDESGPFHFLCQVIAPDGKLRADAHPPRQPYKELAQTTGGVSLARYSKALAATPGIRAVELDTAKGAITPESPLIQRGSYAPFSHVLFFYVRVAALEDPALREFLASFLTRQSDIVKEAGYVPTSPKIQELARRKLADRHTGTHFLDAKGKRRVGTLSALYR